MDEIISKAVLSGLGFASLTGDAIRESARHLVKRSKLSEEEGKRLVKDFQHRAARAERVLKKNVNTAVRKVLKRLDLERIDYAAKGAKAAGKRRKSQGRRRRAVRAAKAH